MEKSDYDLKYYAKVHSVESFGTLDGPGIRFVLFLQGCSLKCKYCHNRDTWDLNAGKIITIDEVINKVQRYIDYITPSGGGITVTGGEPLLQVKSLIPLFKRLKELNIHTALDTSGMFNITDDIKELLSYTDLVLLDIKHINSNKCKDLVGFSNEKELNFARYVSDNNIDLWIRQVLVPGFTDDENDLIELKKFISSLNTVKKVEVLPYHNLGKFKWDNLNLEYPLKDVPQASDEDVKRAKKILGVN